jgi:hypothetical protein
MMGFATIQHAPGKDTAMSYSTLLTLLLTTPSAKDLLPQLLPLAPRAIALQNLRK